MRRGGTRSMPAFRSVMSVLVRFVVRSFSTTSRPALRAAACGGRPRPAVTTRGAIYRPELRTSSQTSAQISRTASDCHMTTANAIRPATTSRRSQGQARLTRSPIALAPSTHPQQAGLWRRRLAEWWALRLLLGVYSPLSIAAIPPESQVGLSWAMDPSDMSWRWPDCHSSCMSAAGLAVPAVVQPDGPVAELGPGDQVEPV